jgi:hypothetical protein
MANGWGGKRRGAGRKPGGFGKRTEAKKNPKLPMIPARAHRKQRREIGLVPIELLLRAVRDETLAMELRLAAATKAAPYFHARVSVGPPKATFEMTDMELDIALAREREFLATAQATAPPMIEGEVFDGETD